MAADEEDGAEIWAVEPDRIPILLVEDDEADAYAMELILAGTPYQAVRASSVRRAQQTLEQLQPAVIVLDVVLLGDESWRLLLAAAPAPEQADIPLISHVLDPAMSARRDIWARTSILPNRSIASACSGCSTG